MASAIIDSATQPTLESVAHSQADEISTILALLQGVLDNEELFNHNTGCWRLVQMAHRRLKAVDEAFEPYI